MELTYLMFPQPEPPPTYQAFQIKMYHHRVKGFSPNEQIFPGLTFLFLCRLIQKKHLEELPSLYSDDRVFNVYIMCIFLSACFRAGDCNPFTFHSI